MACLERITRLFPQYNVANGEERRFGGVHEYIKERTLKIGHYFVETRNTVRTIAKEFGVSKSTVHKDLTERLPEINPELARQVKEILEYHKSIRHIRGGEATKIKYKQKTGKKKQEVSV
jgi:putative DeoR family transcriptional regulator, stage III sporulation protein D